ncbi:hypothetical protein MKX01_035114, partial [Papaver californicum]
MTARLVLALGAEAKLDLVPGAMDFAIPFSTLEDACKVDDKLKELERNKFGTDSPVHVAIVGCGYAGVELAATVSERLQDKGIVQAINVETTICPAAPPGNREAALRVLSSRNVQLLLGYYVSCIRKEEKNEALEKLLEITGDSDDAAKQPYSKQLIVELQPAERSLKSQILEVDSVLWTEGILPATAQVAFQQADFAGWNLWAAINNRPLLPFRFQNLGEMMTLGRSDAAISPSFFVGLTLDGPIGHT